MTGSNFFNAILGLAVNTYISNAFTGGAVSPLTINGPTVNFNEIAYKYTAGGSLLTVPKELNLPLDLVDVAVSSPFGADFSTYTSIQYRWITLFIQNNKVAGEIFIAYKGNATPELQEKMQAKALTVAMGFDQQDGFIKASRQAERQERQKIWDQCAKAGACVNP